MESVAPSPVDDALAELGTLAAAGAGPERMVQAVGAIVAGWATEAEMDAGVAQARIERMWDSLGKDAANLEEAISDTTDAGMQALAGAMRTLAALQAAVAALAAAHGRL